jgi:hypothetical protein
VKHVRAAASKPSNAAALHVRDHHETVLSRPAIISSVILVKAEDRGARIARQSSRSTIHLRLSRPSIKIVNASERV